MSATRADAADAAVDQAAAGTAATPLSSLLQESVLESEPDHHDRGSARHDQTELWEQLGHAERFAWSSVRVRSLVYRARIARWHGDIRQALALSLAAEAEARNTDPRWAAEARLEAALASKMLGDLEEAIAQVHREIARIAFYIIARWAKNLCLFTAADLDRPDSL